MKSREKNELQIHIYYYLGMHTNRIKLYIYANLFCN